ncbi:hypothetical protein [Pseudonocardia spirodelae]|uniref:MFS transporter n=1 Tax=Pseudonocardia spirodelae TaxID=3133431 RepID=A0ABU8TC82_9PSEU
MGATAYTSGRAEAAVGVVRGTGLGPAGLTVLAGLVAAPPVGQPAGLAAAVVLVAVAASLGPVRRAGRVEPAQGVTLA